MTRKILAGFLLVVLAWSFGVQSVLASAPQIVNVRFKAAGNSPKIAVFFDQPVGRTGSGVVQPSDFILGGASSTGAVITNVQPSTYPEPIFVLTLNVNVSAATSSQWTVAASSTLRNLANEIASNTPMDLIGRGDGVAPTVIGAFQHSTSSLDVMFSEEIDSQTGATSTSYANLATSAVGDTPGISSRSLVPERTFVIIGVTASTTLGWGTGNGIDIGGVEDLVGNAMAGTTTAAILPALKISEVKAEGSANAQDEFIELYNFGDLSMSANGLYLHIVNGATDTVKTLTTLRNTIPDKGFYLIGSNTNYSGSLSLDASYGTGSADITANSAVYISATTSTSTAFRMDTLGMGSATDKEATSTAALTAGKSFERKARSTSATSTMMMGGTDEFKGNSWDSQNNALDFVLRDIPQPQNSYSPREFPFGGPGANDTAAPQVAGSFPSGTPGEIIPNTLEYVGFGFTEPVQGNTVGTSTVKLFAGADTANNLCQTIDYMNFPDANRPQGKCMVNPASRPLNTSTTYTFKILGDSGNSTSTVAIRDWANNALNQPGANKGDATGNYVVTFTPSGGGGGFTFQAPPVFVMGTLPFPGAVNIPTNILKAFVKFSGDAATTTLNTTNIQLRKVSDNSAVSLSSVTPAASDPKFSSDIATVAIGATLSANTQYKLTVNGVQDTSARAIPGFEARFTTGAGTDVTGPRVTGRLPNIATGVPVNAIDIHVMTDDRLDPTTIGTTTVKLKQGSNEASGSVEFDPFTGEILFFANNVFQASTAHTVSLNATGTSPCIRNVSGLCLQDDDGVADGKYEFSFTTGIADAAAPRVIFANADQRNLSVTFDEPMKPSEAINLANYALAVGGATSSLSEMAGHRAFYDDVGRTAVLENLNLPLNATFMITVTNVHDLSGNLIGGQNSAQGTVQDMAMTGGNTGPGSGTGSGGGGGTPPTNFSTSTYGFVPQIEVRPFSPLVGATTTYSINIPISRQIPSAGGTLILTFPTGFDVGSAALETQSPTANDVNGPGPGTLGVASLTPSVAARTITISLTANTRCNTGNAAPCSGDAHDFLRFDIRNIANSSIPKDASSGGYTVDAKTLDGTTLLESLTSRPFYLVSGGTNVLQVVATAPGATAGTTTIKIFSPMTGPREAVTTAFTAGVGTSTFTGLVDGDYGAFTESLLTIGGTDYIGRTMPLPVRITGGTTTVTMAFDTTAGLTTVTVNISGVTGKNVDVFAGGGDKFVVKTVTTTGSNSVPLKLSDGKWYVGVGPAMPKGPFSGPPPAPDFVMQPPVLVSITGSSVSESSGTPNDGTVVFTLSPANLALGGVVIDSQNRTIVGADVYAYSPLGGFGTRGTTDGTGRFSLAVAAGMYQVGASTAGMPPARETAVEVRSDGSLVVDGQATSSLALKLIKPERTISGKVLDQGNGPVQGAGVFAYCDPSVPGNACFGPGDHTGGPTNADGSYTLYVRSGTWRVGAFLPGFGELPTVQQVVAGSDITNLNFSPATNVTFRTISGTVCRDTHVSGSSTACGSGDQKVSGVFVRAEGSAGSNQTVSVQDGTYSLRVPSGSGYALNAFDPTLGKMKPITGVDVSAGDATAQDFVAVNPQTVTVNAKDGAGNPVTVNQLYVDFFDFTNQIGNHVELKNATTTTIVLPGGSYRVRASLPGNALPISAIATDSASTAFTTSTATMVVDGAEAIKVIVPALGTLGGTVYSGSAGAGNELSDALVNVTNPSSGIFLSTQSASGGGYSVRLPLGTYTVLAQKPGYLANPVLVTVATSAATTTQNLIVRQASLSISGAVTVGGSPASRAFVRAQRMGGGFAGAQTDSAGLYTLAVGTGTWRVFAMAEGYSATEYATPVEVTSGSVTNINFNLVTQVTLQAPRVCQIVPAEGGECADTTNGVRVVVPPGAFGSDTTRASLTIKQTNARQETSGSKPVGKGFDFEAVSGSGNKINTFNSPVTIELTQNKSEFVANGFTTKTQTDGLKIILWSETLKDYDTLVTTVEYLDGSGNLVAAPAANLSNVTLIRLKGLTTHFTGGGPGGGGDSLSPATPGGFGGSAGTGNTAILNWNTVTTNADGSPIGDLNDYRIWRSTNPNSGFSMLALVLALVSPSYTDSSVSPGTTYYYKVTARDTSANESSQTDASAIAIAAGSSGGGGGYTAPAPTPTVTTTTPTTTPAVIAATTTTATTTPTSVTARPSFASGLLASLFTYTRDLRTGATGDDVGALQTFLVNKGFLAMPPGIAKGTFGSLTRSALQAYQKSAGIPATGNLGPLTRTKINEVQVQDLSQSILPTGTTTTSTAPLAPVSVIRKLANRLMFGMRHDDVTFLQEFLAKDKDLYPEGLATGYFGPATLRAIQRFQEKYGIAKVGDAGYGIVGPLTRAKLNELLGQ